MKNIFFKKLVVECSPPVRKVAGSNHSRVRPKN